MKFLYEPLALRTSVRLTLAAVTSSILSFSALADEQLNSMTVTANRIPTANVLAANTVITRTDIERLNITDLPNLLSRQAGIDVTVSGGVGKLSSAFIRGTNSNHILFLIDGVKWHSATLGSTSIQDFPVEQIERIEIVRGPRSGLYGSEALGGVIQIFTRQGQQGLAPYAKLSYGSHNSKQTAAGISGGTSSTTYNLSVNHQDTDGINATTGTETTRNGYGDKDGYRNNSASTKINHQLTQTVSLGAHFLVVQGDNEYDGGTFSGSSDQAKSESKQQVLGFNTNVKVNKLWSVSLDIAESHDYLNSYIDDSLSSTFNTKHQQANMINTLSISDVQTLNVGLDYAEDKVKSTTDYNKKSRDNKAAFMSWQGTYNEQSWLLSARHDDNEAVGSHKTGSAEWGVWLQNNLQFSLNYGTAFKAPTFNDLYYPNFENPDLKPELANSFAANIRANHAWGSWSFHHFNTEITDLLQYNFATRSTNNIGLASIQGIELEVKGQLLSWDLSLNASSLEPKNDVTGKVLPRRTKRLANLHLDNQWGAWSAGASVKLRDQSFDDAANLNRLGGYGIVDIRTAYQITNDLSLEGTVSNVFDREYQTVKTYNSLDRTFMLSLSYNP